MKEFAQARRTWWIDRRTWIFSVLVEIYRMGSSALSLDFTGATPETAHVCPITETKG